MEVFKMGEASTILVVPNGQVNFIDTEGGSVVMQVLTGEKDQAVTMTPDLCSQAIFAIKKARGPVCNPALLPSKTKVYSVLFDSAKNLVEAVDMASAIAIWKRCVDAESGFTADGEEIPEPESVELLSEEPLYRGIKETWRPMSNPPAHPHPVLVTNTGDPQFRVRLACFIKPEAMNEGHWRWFEEDVRIKDLSDHMTWTELPPH